MQTTHPGRVITAAVLPRSTAINVALVTGFALFTALMAQISIPLGFTPVPITGQTFAVLLSGAALGSRLGPMSQGLYWGMGAIGLPFYAKGAGGWEVATGATAGYLIGFVVAAWVVGRLAEAHQDRQAGTAMLAFVVGTVIIHLLGVPWLANVLDVSWSRAAVLGSYPFIVGDLVKIGLAAVVLPASWKLASGLRKG